MRVLWCFSDWSQCFLLIGRLLETRTEQERLIGVALAQSEKQEHEESVKRLLEGQQRANE